MISFIGLQTQEVDIQPVVKVTLHSDDEMLDEVVVVAYGTQKRSSITGAVSSVSADQIEKRPVTNVTSALEGTTTGVQVNSTYGEPGNGTNNIRIRGFGSINGTNEPLIVVDGVPYEGSLNEINSNDIESMSVLKDASSAALYGNKAANGVILITTRNGKGSRPSLNLDIRQGMYTRGIPEYDRLGINDWMETMWKGYQRYYIVDEEMDAASAAAAVNQTLMSNVIKANIFDKGNTELFTEDGKFVTCDGSGWREDGRSESFPDMNQRFYYATLPSSYNTNIARAVLFGRHTDATGNEYGFAANRLTGEDSWVAYDYTQIDTCCCPNIADGTMIYYDKKLYAFGGFVNSLQHKDYRHPFGTFFSSIDNGLTWQPVLKDMGFPASFRQRYEASEEQLGEGSYSCVVDENNFIWIIWHNGYMSRGRVNRLGFLPKW